MDNQGQEVRLVDNPIQKILRKEESGPIVQSIVFGFGYRARHGKDTVAAIIKQNRGNPSRPQFLDFTPADLGRGYSISWPRYDIRIYSFAAELKREVNENAEKSGGMINLFSPGLRAENFGGYMNARGDIIPLPDWVQYDPDAPMDDPLCPYGKQRTLLQWWGTEFRRNVEPNYWVNKLAKRLADEKPEIALITDMRFPNEVAFVREHGETIKVWNPLVPSVNLHASETSLDYMEDEDWSAIILNDGTLEELKDRTLMVFDSLMEKEN